MGFEPNPNNAGRLLEIEKAYKRCGWKVKFFVETGVSDRNGVSHFFSDNDKANFEWGGGLVKGRKSTMCLAASY